MTKPIEIPDLEPRDYQLPFFEAMDSGIKRALLCWHRRCVAHGSRILLSDGSWKFIEDIKVGDRVLSWNGSELEDDEVCAVYKNGCRLCSTYSVKGAENLSITSDHKVLCASSYFSPKWKPIGELNRSEGCFSYNHLHGGNLNFPVIARFLGYMISDGYCVKEQQPKYTTTSTDLKNDFISLVKKIFPCVFPVVRKKGNGWDIGLSKGEGGNRINHPVKELLDEYDLQYKKIDKRIPRQIWNADKETVFEFLSAVIEADGNIYCQKKGRTAKTYIPPKCEIKISVGQSEPLAWDYYYLLKKHGIHSGKVFNERNWCWTIRIWAAKDVKKLLKNLRLIAKNSHKSEALNLNMPEKKQLIFSGQLIYSRPKKIEIHTSQTYDLEIKKNHNFVCNGYIVHNSGKEVVCWNYMIREAATGRIGTYCYFFPSSSLGKRILWDGANKDGKRFLDYIPKELIDGQPNNVEMKVRLKNGSLIQIIGTERIINVGVNPIGCVFSEFSLQDKKTWDFVRPILRENDGWAVHNFCVKKGTFVITDKGITRIEDVCSSKKEFTNISENIYGLGGFHKANQFYYGGNKKLLKIRTKKGYEISCTPNHQLWDGSKWIRSDEWKTGDMIPIQINQQVWGSGLNIDAWEEPEPKDGRGIWKGLPDWFMTSDWFYILGLYLADGSMNCCDPARGGSITITNKKDPDLIDKLNKLGFKTNKDEIHHKYCSTSVQSFFQWFLSKQIAKNKTIPDKLFECSKDQIIQFLRGYFDGDGTVGKRDRGYIKVCSASEELISVLQILLLNFGVVSRIRKSITKPTKRVKVECELFNLEIEGYFAWKFMTDIGFGLKRKQERIGLIGKKQRVGRGDLVPISPEKIGYKLPKRKISNPRSISYRMIEDLHESRPSEHFEQILKDGFYWDSVTSIDSNEDDVFDFVIPETNSFFSNGFLSHNTPRGRNHAYDLYLMAKNNPDWFCQRLTIEDTGVLSLDDIDAERKSGMSECLIQQEFYVSFNQGVEGSYYAKDLSEAEKQGRVGNVPYDPYATVDTYWDLGVSDSTAILFVQNIGQEVHIIDSYSSEGEGLDHYARVLSKKAEKGLWKYGTHHAPHDIRVRELGHGAKTRLQMAADLGISFDIVPNLSIQEGIEMSRAMWHRIWIDKEKNIYLIKCLENYHKRYNDRLNVYSDKPERDWSSHYNDAFRYLAVMQNKGRRDRMSEEDANKMEMMYRNRY